MFITMAIYFLFYMNRALNMRKITFRCVALAICKLCKRINHHTSYTVGVYYLFTHRKFEKSTSGMDII